MYYKHNSLNTVVCHLHSLSSGTPSPLDPYDNYFRVRLICTLLDTCGQYFDRGSGKKKLDAFLVFFQVSKPQTRDSLIFT